MARINWHGTTYAVTPLEQLPNGDWLMQSLEHGPRFTIGTKLQVKAADIVSMDEAKADPGASLGAVEKAMAEERKTLPTVRELLLKQARANAEPAP